MACTLEEGEVPASGVGTVRSNKEWITCQGEESTWGWLHWAGLGGWAELWLPDFQDAGLASHGMKSSARGVDWDLVKRRGGAAGIMLREPRPDGWQHYLGFRMLDWSQGEEEAPDRRVGPGHGDKESLLSLPTYFVLRRLSSTNSRD